MLFCLWVTAWVQWLIKFFEIKYARGKPPVPLGFIGRKQSVDFKHTTLETFKRIIPSNYYEIRQQEQEIVFWRVAKVYYGGLDDRLRINKFNSAEFAFVGIDQAEETERTDVDVLQAALRLKFKGKQPPYKELYTANPAECWLKEDFIDNKRPNHYFIPALYTDNPHLPENYQQTLEKSFKYNTALLKAYRDGDWYALQATNALVSSAQLDALKEVHIYPQHLRRIVSCDPSLGGDACVIMLIENGAVKDQKVLYERDQMKIAGEMVIMGNKWNCPNYACDTTGGLGSAILDRIREVVRDSNRFYANSSEKLKTEDAQYNMRAEYAYYFMTKVLDRTIPWIEDEELRTQILAHRFEVVNSNGTIKMEPKDKVKERIGRSPDHSDCYFIGLYYLDQTEPIVEKDGWRVDSNKGPVVSAVKSAMSA